MHVQGGLLVGMLLGVFVGEKDGDTHLGQHDKHDHNGDSDIYLGCDLHALFLGTRHSTLRIILSRLPRACKHSALR